MKKVLLASKHKKEEVIGPLFEANNMKIIVPENFDTDQWGTFDGNIQRKYNPLATARNKCLSAMEQFNFDCAVASEGSFGPHPFLGLVNVDEEWLYYIDRNQEVEIWAKEMSTDTNFNKKEVKRYDELKEFCSKIGFPEHGVILSGLDQKDFYKGICEEKKLKEKFDELIKTNPTVLAQTDMRACYNPKRMLVIKEATKKLINKINTQCPSCGTPGYDISEIQTGLPCTSCKQPTKSILKHLYKCKKCGFNEEKLFPMGKKEEDPMYCDYCNP